MGTLYRKELLDTLKDRKALLFMILLPTFISPTLIFVLSNLALNIVKETAVQEVRVAADAQSQERYEALVHRWFVRSKIGRTVAIAQNPVVRMITASTINLPFMKDIPPRVTRDPAVFSGWTRELAVTMRDLLAQDFEGGGALEGLGPGGSSGTGASRKAFGELASDIGDFYLVAIRGLGLVNFVRPDELKGSGPPPPPQWNPDGPLANHSQRDRIFRALKGGEIQAYLSIPDPVVGLSADNASSATIWLYYDSTNVKSQETWYRLSIAARKGGQAIVGERMSRIGLTPAFQTPVTMASGTNIASRSQITLSILGGLLPYLVLSFAFLGGLYPAIDLGAGEKERGTLETLLLSPASRLEIALSKLLLIFTTSMTATLLGVVTLGLSIRYLAPPMLLDRLELEVGWGILVSVAMLAVPPAMVFASLFLTVSIFARSFKEAQNYLSPMGLVLLLPPAAAMIPGIEINNRLALIPMVNVSLLARDFLQGDVSWYYYGLTMASCLGFAAICLTLCVWMFHRESVLFRS